MLKSFKRRKRRKLKRRLKELPKKLKRIKVMHQTKVGFAVHLLPISLHLLFSGKADDKVATAATAEAEPAAPVKKEEATASGPPSSAVGPAVERQDSRQGGGKHGNHAAGHTRLAKTNSAGGPGDKGVQVSDKRSGGSQRQTAAGAGSGQPNHNKRTERPKSPLGAGK